MLTWLVRVARYIWLKRVARTITLTRSWIFWSLEPAILLLCLGLASTGVFFHIRFAASQNALDRYVVGVRSGDIDTQFEFNHPTRRVGLYNVTSTDSFPDGTVRMITSD